MGQASKGAMGRDYRELEPPLPHTTQSSAPHSDLYSVTKSSLEPQMSTNWLTASPAAALPAALTACVCSSWDKMYPSCTRHFDMCTKPHRFIQTYAEHKTSVPGAGCHRSASLSASSSAFGPSKHGIASACGCAGKVQTIFNVPRCSRILPANNSTQLFQSYLQLLSTLAASASALSSSSSRMPAASASSLSPVSSSTMHRIASRRVRR